MAETLVTKSATASIDVSTGVVNFPLTGLVAGEDIALCDLVYIKSDGKIWRATAAAANAAAKAIGIAPRAAKAGQPITVFPGPNQVVRYSDAGFGTPGVLLFVGETAGALSSIATTGDAVGFAQVVDSSNIRLIRAY
jgi:hypothetical protein